MRIPYNFESITLRQFMQLHELNKKDGLSTLDLNIQRLSILSGKSIEYLEDLDLKVLQKYINKIEYVKTPPKNLRVVKRFWLGGQLFKPTVSLEDMKANQLVDYNSISKSVNGDNASVANKLLAIMFKPYKLFGKTKYTPDNHAKISEKLLDAKVGDCLGLLFFYNGLWKRCEKHIIHYLQNSQLTIQKMMQEIEMDKSFQDLLNTGAGSTTSTTAQKVKR